MKIQKSLNLIQINLLKIKTTKVHRERNISLSISQTEATLFSGLLM
jgi:hypothetical protein